MIQVKVEIWRGLDMQQVFRKPRKWEYACP